MKSFQSVNSIFLNKGDFSPISKGHYKKNFKFITRLLGNVKISNTVAAVNVIERLLFNPIGPSVPFSLSPENIRKSYGFLMFSRGRERMHWERMG